MKYCQHCGGEINDEAVICIHCGRSVQEQKTAKSNNSDSLLVIAKVFMIISCALYPAIGLLYGLIMLIPAIATATAELIIVGVIVLVCFCIPLAWMLPMTLTVNKKIKEREPIGITLKICTLLFVNLIAGVLLLCHNDD